MNKRKNPTTEIEHLRGALVAIRNLIENDPDNLNQDSVTDTVWIGPTETLVDFIDAALGTISDA